jgi:energy-coupling factor transporter ATP-binding protein EcfA2
MIIRSNFKNLPPIVRIEEGNYIFLHGPNGCGKSAIAHSVEYALTGQIADAAGRNIKSKAYVNTLAHEPTAEVEVLLDGMAHNGTRPRYNNVVADAMAALTGSSTALVQYMLEYGERFDTTETTVALDYPSWDQWVKAEGSVRGALLRIQKAAGASLRQARAAVKDLKTVLKYGESEGARDMLADALRAEAEAKALKKACDDAAIEWLKQVTQFAPHGAIQFYFGSEVRLGLRGKGPVSRDGRVRHSPGRDDAQARGERLRAPRPRVRPAPPRAPPARSADDPGRHRHRAVAHHARGLRPQRVLGQGRRGRGRRCPGRLTRTAPRQGELVQLEPTPRAPPGSARDARGASRGSWSTPWARAS